MQSETVAALLLPTDFRAEPKIDCMLALVLLPTISQLVRVALEQYRVWVGLSLCSEVSKVHLRLPSSIIATHRILLQEL